LLVDIQFFTVLGFMKKEVKVMSKKSVIHSEQEFVGTFLEESVGMQNKKTMNIWAVLATKNSEDG